METPILEVAHLLVTCHHLETVLTAEQQEVDPGAAVLLAAVRDRRRGEEIIKAGTHSIICKVR